MFGGNVSPAATLSNPFATCAPLALPPTTPFNAVAFCATCCACLLSSPFAKPVTLPIMPLHLEPPHLVLLLQICF
jgi:hypothetical protein